MNLPIKTLSLFADIIVASKSMNSYTKIVLWNKICECSIEYQIEKNKYNDRFNNLEKRIEVLESKNIKTKVD
jgi:hypothetical protein